MERELVRLLSLKKLKISSCESCTGGLVSKLITEVPGSSDVFEFGAVTYANEFKMKVASVPDEVLSKYGAVSEQCAFYMAKGIKEFSGSDIGVSTTGIAGPGGGTTEKPVGLVYTAVYSGYGCEVVENRFDSSLSRDIIRQKSADKALSMAIEHIKKYF